MRHNLFKVSEPFIVEQAGRLRRYRPVYLGRLRYGTAPAGTESLVLRDRGRWAWPRIGWQMVSRDPRPYERLLVGRRPALIHAHFGVEGVYALPLARRLGVPLVTTFHGFDATLSDAALLASPATAQYPLHRRRLAAQGGLFLCASSFIRDRVIRLGFPPERVLTHYIGVDCEAITPRAAQEEAPVILSVARLVAVKGGAYLIRAFARIAGRFPEAVLVMIGEGPLRRRLLALAASLGLEGRVRFLGALPHPEVLAWMRKAAMLVLPGIRTATGRVEGLGLVSVEAAATGVPVIGSDLGGIPEAVIDGETGFLVPSRDEEALARRMAELLGDAALRRRCGEAGRALACRRFDIGRQTARLEDLYDSVVPA